MFSDLFRRGAVSIAAVEERPFRHCPSSEGAPIGSGRQLRGGTHETLFRAAFWPSLRAPHRGAPRDP
jgi:hypothetical protein